MPVVAVSSPAMTGNRNCGCLSVIETEKHLRKNLGSSAHMFIWVLTDYAKRI